MSPRSSPELSILRGIVAELAWFSCCSESCIDDFGHRVVSLVVGILVASLINSTFIQTVLQHLQHECINKLFARHLSLVVSLPSMHLLTRYYNSFQKNVPFCPMDDLLKKATGLLNRKIHYT